MWKGSGACSYLGAVGPKVGGALASPALWLPRPCSAKCSLLVSRYFELPPPMIAAEEKYFA